MIQNKEWIRVEDQLPPYRVKVILHVLRWRLYWSDIKEVTLGYRSCTHAGGEQYTLQTGNDNVRRITHWIPLPEKPKI